MQPQPFCPLSMPSGWHGFLIKVVVRRRIVPFGIVGTGNDGDSKHGKGSRQELRLVYYAFVAEVRHDEIKPSCRQSSFDLNRPHHACFKTTVRLWMQTTFRLRWAVCSRKMHVRRLEADKHPGHVSEKTGTRKKLFVSILAFKAVISFKQIRDPHKFPAGINRDKPLLLRRRKK